MIKDNSNYLYLNVPNEYRCVYYNILDTLGTLGEDLLSACTATCKGKAINGIACYNMFNAACACYYLGQVKRARVLISYIKAQLNICCDKFLVFKNSYVDQFTYLKVPVIYKNYFEAILEKMSSWGQALLDDCTMNCQGRYKDLMNCWNLFKAAIYTYDLGNEKKSDYIMEYIDSTLGLNVAYFRVPALTNFMLEYTINPGSETLVITGASVSILHEENIFEKTLSLIDTATGIVIVGNLPVKETFDLGLTLPFTIDSRYKFMLQVVGKDNRIYNSNIVVIGNLGEQISNDNSANDNTPNNEENHNGIGEDNSNNNNNE